MSTPFLPAFIEFDDLAFGHGGHPLLTGVQGQITAGVTLVRGGDGRGKTTLLRLLAHELKPDSGKLGMPSRPVQIFRTDPGTLTFDPLTVPAYFESLKPAYPTFNEAHLPALIDGLGLEPHLHKQLFMLSTGTKRKVWLAAAFASGAAVLLLDEPFAALDGPSMAFVTTLLQQASAQTRQAVVVADYEAPAGVILASTIDLGD